MKSIKINKKAMEAGILIAIIITIASFVLIAGTVGRFLSNADEKQAERICHDSIALRAAITIRAGSTDIALAPPLCKTIDKKIKGDKKEIMQQFSDKMARCWWMFGEGRYEQILDDPKFGTDFRVVMEKVLSLPKGGNDCFVCYTMSIDEDEIEGGTVMARDLAKYLAETDYKKVKEKKYLEYIQSYGGPGSVAVWNDVTERGSYGIAFFSKNKKGSGSYWTSAITALAGAGIVVCAIVEPCGIIGAIVGGAALGFGGTAGVMKAVRDNFGSDERDVSIIAVDDLKTVESYGCARDIAGE